MDKPEGHEYLTVGELTSLLRVTRASIYDYIKAGKLKGIRVGRRRLFSKAEIIEFLGHDPFIKKPDEVAMTPELHQAREELKRLDAMRQARGGEELIKFIKPLLRVFRKYGDVYGLGYAEFIEGGALLNIRKLPKAATLLKSSLETARRGGFSELEGRILGTLAVVHAERARYEDALRDYLQAARIFEDLRAKDKLAITYQNLGVLYGRLNRPLEALFHFQRALETTATVKMPLPFEPDILISLSNIYQVLGDYSQAFSTAKRAYNLGLKRHLNDIIVRASNGMGRALWNMDDEPTAREYFRISYEYWLKLSPGLKDSRLSMAINSLIALEDYKGCLELLKRKETKAKERQDEPVDLSGTFINYAKCYIGLGQPAEAIEYADRGLRRQMGLGQLAALWHLMRVKAKAYAAAKDHRNACTTFKEALFGLDAEIDRASGEGLPAIHSAQLGEIHDEYAYEIFDNEDSNEAFVFMTLLINHYIKRVIADNKIMPDILKGRYTARKLARNRATIVDFHSKMTFVPPGKLKPSEIKWFKERLERLRRQNAQFLAQLSKGNPLSLPLQGEEGPTVKEIKGLFAEGRIPKNASILTIYIAEKRGHGFLLDEKGIRERKDLPTNRAEIRQYLDVFFNGCKAVGSILEAGIAPPLDEQKYVKSVLMLLYQRLLKPFEGTYDASKPLIVVTNGLLNLLPFHALHDGRQWVCETHSIYRLLSPAFLRAVQCRATSNCRKPSKILVASSWSRTESEKVIGFLKNLPPKRCVVRIGDGAVVKKVRPEMNKYESFLYFGECVCHTENPEMTNLKMHDGPGLTAYDLFTQRYDLSNLQSVILYTGGFNRNELESSVPFLPVQRGFLTAGAGLVATFLWKLDVSNLQRVLTTIYSAPSPGGFIGLEAIRHAQKKLIADPLTSHPYFWAGIHIFNLTLENRHDNMSLI